MLVLPKKCAVFAAVCGFVLEIVRFLNIFVLVLKKKIWQHGKFLSGVQSAIHGVLMEADLPMPSTILAAINIDVVPAVSV